MKNVNRVLFLSAILVVFNLQLQSQTLSVCGSSNIEVLPSQRNTSSLTGVYNSANIFFNSIYDRFGNSYQLKDLALDATISNGAAKLPAAATCTAGYFRLYFAVGSGMETNTAISLQRRAVICQLFTDIAGFVNPSFATSTSTAVVNILIEDINVFSYTPSTLGMATPYYAFPNNPSNPNPGITDNLIYKTIVTEQDAFNGIAPPYIATGGSGFFHGVMAFNFSNPSITWNTNLSIICPATEFDLYTIGLHELTHALGFASLISATGISKFGALNNYYARYDKFLQTQSNNSLVPVPANNCSNQTSLIFSVLPSVLGGTTGCITDVTNCGTAIKYVSGNLPNMPVYTPNCFEPPSSLSHFEDMCYPTNTPANNNTYFVMSNANGPGVTKRYLKPEERLVLCDIGYTVNTIYNTPAVAGSTTYVGGNCTPPLIFGVNDGITAGVFTYSTTGTTLTIPIVGGVMANDATTTASIICVNSVYLNGSATVVGNNIQFTAVGGYSGPILIQYIPVDAAGNEGNITYVFGYIFNSSCVSQNVCDVVPNGGFENGVGCGPIPFTAFVGCWNPFIWIPDVFKRNCTTSTASAANLGTSTFSSSPVFDSWSGIAGNNNSVIGLTSVNSYTAGNVFVTSNIKPEAMYTKLFSPLIPGQSYVLNFKAYNYTGPLQDPSAGNTSSVTINSNGYKTVVGFMVTNSVPLNVGPLTLSFSTPINEIINTTTLTAPVNNWQNYSTTFTFNPTSGSNGNYLTFGTDGIQCTNQVWVANSNTNGFYYQYCLVDDISIYPTSLTPSINLPNPVCSNSIFNLQQYISTPQTGTFSGTGVTQNGGLYDFNASNTLAPGVYPITYNFVTTNNCSLTTAYSATVLGINVNTNASSCNGGGYTLSALSFPPLSTYTWLPGGANTSTIAVNPTANTVYTLVANSGTCINQYTTAINLYNTPSINTLPAFCIGVSTPTFQTYIALATPTIGNFTGLNIINGNCSGVGCSFVSPQPPAGIYNYTYTLPANPSGGYFCPVSTTFNVQFAPNYTLSASTNGLYCSNLALGGATLSATATPSAGVTFTWLPGTLVGATQTVSPASTTIYTVSAANSGGCLYTSTVSVVANSACCSANNYVTSSTLSTGSYSTSWAINQNITISGTVNLTGEYLMAPNVSITIPSGSILDISGGHLYGCGNMWSGITVDNGGRVRITKESLIEDAVTAVYSNGSTNTSTLQTLLDLDIDLTIFNRNYIAIKIANYTQPITGAAFSVNRCVFTSRSIPFTTGATPTWPNTSASISGLLAATGATNTLFSPYLLGGYSAINLKVPNATIQSSIAVLVENSGITSNPTFTNPTYYNINIGSNLYTTDFNIIDNHMFGIYARNSNVVSINNLFQNTKRQTFGIIKAQTKGGYGIYSINDNTFPANGTNFISTVATFSASLFINKFYNCHYGIGAYNIFELNAQYCDFRSTQASGTSVGVLSIGQFAIHVTGNQFKNYQLKNNKIQNINTGVYFNMFPNFLNIAGVGSNYGQYLGRVAVQNNLFSPTTNTTAAIGTGYINYGVYAGSSLSNSNFTYFETNPILIVNDNTFSRNYRGVYGSGFNMLGYGMTTANNTITLVADANPLNTQYGVYCSNGYGNVINSNIITGYNTTNTFVTGVYGSMNSAPSNTAIALNSVQCNSVTNLFAGFQFESYNVGSQWRNNSMQTNKRGLYLSNNAILGQQGNGSSAIDNKWNGATWTGTVNYSTFTDASFPNNSKLFVRFGNPYFPTNNANTFSLAIQTYTNGLGINPAGGAFFTCPTNGGGGGGGCPTCKVALLDSIATNNVTYSLNVAETEEIFKTLAFNDVVNEPTIANATPSLTTFYATNLSQTRGMYKTIEANLTQGNLNLVATLLAAFTPTTNIENNYKTLYSLQKTYMATGSLTFLENLQLAILAHQCPFTDGAVVYNARVFYSLVNSVVVNYNDTYCTQIGFSFRTNNDSTGNTLHENFYEQLVSNEQITKTKFKTVLEYKLYPNPAINEVAIISNFVSERLEVKITDVNGKLLLSKTLNINNYRADLKFDLINGIYFVNLINEKGEKSVKKLVIAK